MALTFVDELPEGIVKRRTTWTPVIDEVKANPGRWAMVKSYDGLAADKVSRKASELRNTLKRVVEAETEIVLQYEVRTPSTSSVQGFLRFPTEDQYEDAEADNNQVADD